MDSSYPYQKVAFLDTNVIHYIGLYLEHAKNGPLFPWDGAAGDRERAVAAARSALKQVPEDNLKDTLTKGLKIAAMVETDRLIVQYATVSELELITGRAKGQAILDAAAEGLPHRMWSRYSEEEINRRVSMQQLEDIRADVGSITELLEDAGISVERRADRVAEVFELAVEINGLVYVDGMDSVIYASALLFQADFLYTADGYLRRTVSRIANPAPGSRYPHVQRRLRRAVGGIILTDPDRVVVPTAPRLIFPATMPGPQGKGPPRAGGSGAS